MVADERGNLKTLRQIPKMALVETTVTDDMITTRLR